MSFQHVNSMLCKWIIFKLFCQCYNSFQQIWLGNTHSAQNNKLAQHNNFYISFSVSYFFKHFLSSILRNVMNQYIVHNELHFTNITYFLFKIIKDFPNDFENISSFLFTKVFE